MAPGQEAGGVTTAGLGGEGGKAGWLARHLPGARGLGLRERSEHRRGLVRRRRSGTAGKVMGLSGDHLAGRPGWKSSEKGHPAKH